jgi:hypothetical protein
MAADLAPLPRTEIVVQLCGDAHLSNFGLFASPERTLVFDITDFDENAARTVRGSQAARCEPRPSQPLARPRARRAPRRPSRDPVVSDADGRIRDHAGDRRLLRTGDATSILGLADKHARPFLQETVHSAPTMTLSTSSPS